MNRTPLGPAEAGPEPADLASRLSTDELAITGYELPPGEGVPGGFHAHADQEELFVVLAGHVTVETVEDTVAVPAGELIRFERGEFHRLRNDGTEPLRMVGLGVPPETTDIRLPTACPSCGHEDRRLDFDEAGARFVCPECEQGQRPAPCPACGGDDIGFELDRDREPKATCRDCGSRYDDPPVAD